MFANIQKLVVRVCQPGVLKKDTMVWLDRARPHPKVLAKFLN